MYRGFCVVVNDHISLPLPCHTTFHVLLKGDAGGKPRVRVPALLLPAWLLCVWLSAFPPGGFLSTFHLSDTQAPYQQRF